MPSVNFHFDRRGDCKNPGQAIAWLQDTRARGSLSDFWAGFAIPNRIDLQDQALLMMGTTANLQRVLLQDYANGVVSLETAGAGSMGIRYVRRRAGLETKTVVIIASDSAYWAPGGHFFGTNEWRDLWPGYNQAISIETLANHVVPRAKGVNAWW
jgi:hypothetical protein